MGVSIHGDGYLVDQVVKDIDAFVQNHGGYRDGALRPREWFNKVAGSFGLVLDKWFLTVYNEYYEDYNPERQFVKAVEQYYFPNYDEETNEWLDFDLTSRIYFGGGANASEILADKFDNEFGYEGTFSAY